MEKIAPNTSGPVSIECKDYLKCEFKDNIIREDYKTNEAKCIPNIFN